MTIASTLARGLLAASILAPAAALAQDAPVVGTPAAPALETPRAAPNLLEVENEALTVEPYGISVDDLEDTDIEDATGNVIGEVDEVLMTPTGEIVAVSAEVGGFLGIGDHEVVIELGMLRPEGDRLHVDMTKEEAEALPVWDD